MQPRIVGIQYKFVLLALLLATIYVTNEASDDVSVLEDGKEVARIPVGKRPRGLKLDGARLYVAVSGSPRAGPGVDESTLPPGDRSQDGIAVVDLAARKVIERLPGGTDPEAFDVRGGRIYVSNEDAAMLSVVDIAARKVAGSAQVGGQPEGVRVTPDGRTVYVTSEEDGEIDALDASSLKLLARIPVAPRPRGIAFTPDGARAFVTAEQGACVNVIDAKSHRPLERIAIAGKGAKPMGLAMSRDGARLYVSTGRGGAVVEIDTQTGKVVRTFEKVGARPWGLALEGDVLYSANGPSNDVSRIDLKTGAVQRIPAGGSPWGVAAR